MLYTMFPELVVLSYFATKLRGRLAEAQADERGYSTETVVITAILVLMAIGAAGIISVKVLAKAESIETE